MGNDSGGSAGELVNSTHPLMQDTTTGTQKTKGIRALVTWPLLS